MGVSSQGRSFSVMRMAKVVLISVWLTVVSAAPQLFPADQAGVVSTVISTLQPAIAQAVANALRGQQTAPPAPPAPPAPVSTDNLASYQYEYKIASDQTQTYISQQERRDGNQVSGVYSYVDPTGAIVTVYYEAGEGGYQETRERQEGAVQIRAQPAGAAPTPGAGAGAGAGGVDVESLIARVLAALQPAIEQTVASYL